MSIVTKPWGFYEDYFRSGDVVFKRIEINPGHSISYQVHDKRNEFWYIQSGLGRFKYSVAGNPKEEYSISTVRESESIEIVKGVCHQLTNIGATPLIVYEMQYGNCSEDDILRLDDPYNR